MGKQRLQARRRQLCHGALVAGGGLQREMLEQQRNILAALAQRGQVHGHHIETVVEIGAKQALTAEFQQIDLGCSNHTAVDGNERVRAQALQHSFLQHAQQLGLHGQGHAFDLVEKQGAAAGMFDLADALFARAGKGPGLAAEHFAVKQRLRQAAAVDGDKIAALAPAGFMQAARDSFLAGARFPPDQHIGLAGRKALQCAAQLLHGKRAPQQLVLQHIPTL